MFQLSIEFLCLLNNRAPRPLGRIPVGHRELPLWPGHVLSGLPPFRPAWLTRPHELQASELAGSGLPSGGSDKSCGCGGAGWGRLCFGRARAPGCPVPGHHHAQWLLPFNHRRPPLVSPEPEGGSAMVPFYGEGRLREDRTGYAQGRSAGKSQGWGSNGLF